MKPKVFQMLIAAAVLLTLFGCKTDYGGRISSSDNFPGIKAESAETNQPQLLKTTAFHNVADADFFIMTNLAW